MATWAEFAAAAPDLAERGAKRLGVGVAYIATTANDGSPRISPFTPLIGGGRLLALIGKHTAKYSALLRDPRCAIHAWLGDSDEEFMLVARATPSDDWATRMQAAIEAKKINMTSQNDVAFEFTIERAHWAIWEGLGTPDIRRVAQSWSASGWVIAGLLQLELDRLFRRIALADPPIRRYPPQRVGPLYWLVNHES